MIARYCGFLLLLISLFSGSPALAARLAFVVGNDAYLRVPQLQHAGADAEAIGSVLQKLGYTVTVARDLDYKGMAHALADFSSHVQPGDTVVFQFSGHGVAIDGRNYLLPVDIEEAGSGDPSAIEALSFDANKIMAQLAARRPSLVFAILDACRNNPFEAKSRSVGTSRGLARMDAEPGEFILFSAGPGEEALDGLGRDDREGTSVFTRVLLKSIVIEGITLQKLAKATQGGVTQLAASVHHEQFPDYFDRTVDEPVLSSGPAQTTPPSSSSQCASPLSGRWDNGDPTARNIDHITISTNCVGEKTAFTVEIFGRCTPTPCPWGVRPAVLDSGRRTLTARFDFGFAVKAFSAELKSDQLLSASTATRFFDSSGRKPRSSTETLSRVPDAPP